MPADIDINVTYAAVGRAASAWESLEAHLSYLYSIFLGKPTHGRIMQEYGKDGRIFDMRMQALCKAAQVYFRRAPHQSHEATVDSFIFETRRLSIRRHQIVHGFVSSSPMFFSELNIITPGFFLVPPLHGIFHLTKTTGHYLYSSKEIDAYTDAFNALASRVKDFCDVLYPVY
jgi:hypothetical protein